MKNGANNIDDLLMKYLLGEASETESREAELWINSSADNKKHYDDVKLIWDNSRNILAGSTISTDEAWGRFKQRAERKTTSISSNSGYKWLKIAALVLLTIGAGTTLFLNRENKEIAVKSSPTRPNIVKSETLDNNSKITDNESVNDENEKTNTVAEKHVAAAEKGRQRKKSKLIAYNRPTTTGKSKLAKEKNTSIKTKGVICNNTPCPIEICITQTIKCNKGSKSTVSTCSTLEPDESGRLHYTTHDKIGRHCTMSIDEITIKTVSTGETIVLNANSKPSTAQDFFQYITGKKKGGIIAGVFHNDCDANAQDCGLKFDNNFGDLILQ